MSKQTAVDEKPKSNGSMLVFILIIALVLALFFYMFSRDNEQPQLVVDTLTKNDSAELIEPIEPIDVNPEPEPTTLVEPQPEPVVQSKPVEPQLPELDNSDSMVVDYFKQQSVQPSLFRVLLTDDLVRRTVVFVDNFAKGELAYKHLPLKPLTDKFQVVKDQQMLLTTNKSNWQRYQSYISLLQSFEPEQLLATYRQLQPLFEQAYDELGYPDTSFDDALQQAMKRILNAKVATGEEALVQPNVVYKFAQPSVEKLPATDKLMLRLGRENLLQLKAVVLEIDRLMQQGK